MNTITKDVEHDKVIYIENIKKLGRRELPLNKKLCIIKTNFRDLALISNFCKDHPQLDIWLTAENITCKNIFNANSCGIKNVLQYPIQQEVLNAYFKPKSKLTEKGFKFDEKFLKNKKILILDNNVMNIELLKSTLAPLNLDIHGFQNSQKAIESLNEIKYDLFLLDIVIPEISGFDVAQIIKASKLNHSAPIIFVSALSDAENKIAGYNLGSVAYIEKPFNVNVVRTQIYNILKNKSLQEEQIEMNETFLAMITHDLKAPISAEICALELLLKNKTDNDFEHEIICDLLNSSKYMKSLVENILLKYNSENNKLSTQFEYHSLEEIIQKSIEEIRYLTQDKNQNIVFENETAKSLCYVDRLEIKRTINNLLSNANQYSDSNETITIKLKENRKNFIIEVINESERPGLKVIKDDIFEKFVQYHKSNKTVHSGLGLFICKKIVDLHHGEIHYEQPSGKQHKVWFTLPKSETPLK